MQHLPPDILLDKLIGDMGDAGVNAITPTELHAGIEAALKSKSQP